MFGSFLCLDHEGLVLVSVDGYTPFMVQFGDFIGSVLKSVDSCCIHSPRLGANGSVVCALCQDEVSSWNATRPTAAARVALCSVLGAELH